METEDNTRDLIIESSITLFYQKGYKGTSVADIANECDITAAAIYYHFKNKDHILWECYERLIRELNERVVQEVRTESSPEERMEKFIGTVFNLWFERPELALLQSNPIAPLNESRREQYKLHRDNWHSFVVELISDLDSSFKNDAEVDICAFLLSKSLSYPEMIFEEFGTDYRIMSGTRKKQILKILKRFYLQALMGKSA